MPDLECLQHVRIISFIQVRYGFQGQTPCTIALGPTGDSTPLGVPNLEPGFVLNYYASKSSAISD